MPNKAPIHMIVPIPPPINGMTLVTDAVVVATGARAQIYAIQNTRPTGLLPWGVRRHLLFARETFKAALRSRGKDIAYFVPSARSGLIFNLLLSPLLRTAFKQVWLHHHVSRYFRQRDWRLSLFLRILGTKASHITLSDEMSADLHRLYGSSESISINNAAFLSAPPLHVSDEGELKTIGFIGNVSEEKGIFKFIEVVEKLNGLGIATKALVAGPCDNPDVSQEVTAFVERSPTTRRYLGLVSGDAKAKFFRDTDIVLFPSSYANEAQPMVIFEALANGVPVLATTVGYIAEQLTGTPWSIQRENYVAKVTEQIKVWAEDADSFKESRRKATATFASKKKLSEEQLQDWVTKRT